MVWEWAETIAFAAGRDDHAALYEAAYDLELTIVRGAHGGIVFNATTVNIDAGSGLARKTNDNHLNVVFKSDPAAVKSKRADPILEKQGHPHLSACSWICNGRGSCLSIS